ncbi:hypothetical protein [Actinoplanes xinjiangensis]
MAANHHDAGLCAYQCHSAHLELGGWLRPWVTARAVVDYTRD